MHVWSSSEGKTVIMYAGSRDRVHTVARLFLGNIAGKRLSGLRETEGAGKSLPYFWDNLNGMRGRGLRIRENPNCWGASAEKREEP